MLYNLDFLSKQANPLIYRAWVVGTRGIAAAPSKPKLTTSDILKLCEIIFSFMSSKSNEAKDRFSVRMSHTLLLGMLDLFINMVDNVNRDMDQDLKRKSSIKEIQDVDSPEIIPVAAKKKPTKVRAEKKAPSGRLEPLEEDVLDAEERRRRITLIEDLPVQRMEEDEHQLELEPIPDATRMEVQAEVHMAQEAQIRSTPIPEDHPPAFFQVQADVPDTELEERQGTREIPMEVEEIPAVPARRMTREHSPEIQPLPIEVHATVEPQGVEQLPKKRKKMHSRHKQNFLLSRGRRVLSSHINKNETLEEPLEELLQIDDFTSIKAKLIKKGFLPSIDLGQLTDKPASVREGSVESSQSLVSLAGAGRTSGARESPIISLLRRTDADTLPELQVTDMEEILREPVLISSSPKQIDQRAEEPWSAPQMEHADITEVEHWSAPQMEHADIPEAEQLEREHQLTHLERRLKKIIDKMSTWDFENKLTIEDFVDQRLTRFAVAVVFSDLLGLQALGYTKMHPQENSNEVDHVTKGPKFDLEL